MNPAVRPTPATEAKAAAPLLEILGALDAAGYDFVTPTRATYALVSGRLGRARPGSLRDVFGWCRPFHRDDLDVDLVRLLGAAEALKPTAGGLLQSRVRVARLDGQLYVHSAPSGDPDQVFVGPDSYRFARFIRSVAADIGDVRRAVDIGAGAGVGALTVASLWPEADVWAGDISEPALIHAWINAQHAGRRIHVARSDGLSALEDQFDLIVCNPPYIAGRSGAVYRDGGAGRGTEIALRWAREAIGRLTPDGAVLLYTGSPIIDGEDEIRGVLTSLKNDCGLSLRYEEIDPDVFGSTLQRDDYKDVERIAAVGALLRCLR